MEIVVDRIVECRSPVRSLWAAVADTERTNRAIGMEQVSYRPLNGEGAARFVGATTLGGFEVEYEEQPTEWEVERYFAISRRMRSGPVESIRMRFDFTPRGDRCEVRVELIFAARTALLAPVLRLRARQSVDRIAAEIARVDGELAQGRRPSLPQPAQIDEDALRGALRALRRRSGSELVDRLERHLRQADDVEVARMRPYALADEWGVDRRELLGVMLEAVKAGMLELRWEVICPSCRGAVDTMPTLAQLTEHGRCQLCELDFGLDMDEALEAAFSPSRAVRKVAEGPFCLAGPARVPHVLSQHALPARGAASLTAPKEPGRYRLFVRGGASSQLVVAADGEASAAVDASALPERLSVRPGAAIEVRNPHGVERHMKIERAAWAQLAVSVRDLTSMPHFRRDFSSDLLRPGASLRVARVALFFSDLTGSTQLYSRVGDAAAFRLVQDHFDLVLALIEQHGGAVVKTIGDAVMAVFADELAAVGASMAILRAFEGFREGHEHRAMTHIKLGVYAGPCYVVTANGVLDYFGQSVNLAARLQAQADSGELVVARELADEAVARGLIAPEQITATYAASLKGVDGAVEVARLRAPR